MKRFQIGTVLLTMLLLFTAGAHAQTTDVSPDHWAFEAVQSLIDRGYLDVDDDGAFRGEQPMERYDFAAAIAALLSDIEAGRVQVRAATDAEMLRELEQEFRAELVQWYAERDALEAAHGQTQRAMAAIDEQLNVILFGLQQVEMDMERLEGAQAAAYDALVDAFDAGLAAEAGRTDEQLAARDVALADLSARIETVIEDTDVHVERLETNLSDLGTTVGGLRNNIGRLQEALQDALAMQDDEFGARFGEQMDALSTLDDGLDELRDELAALNRRLDNQRNEMNDMNAALFLRLTTTVDELEADLQAQIETVGQQAEQLSAALAELRTEADDRRADDAARFEQLLSELEDRLIANADTFDSELQNEVGGLRGMLRVLDGRQEEQEKQLEALAAELATTSRRAETLIDTLRHTNEAVAELQDHLVTLAGRGETVRGDVDRMADEVNTMRAELDGLQGIIGLSEEQIANLTDRVRRDLDEQLSLSLARESRLERQFQELQNEFDSYRAKTESDIQSSRSTGTIAIGVAVVALILGFAN